MTGIHEVQVPSAISSGGPGYSTMVVTAVSGHEWRNANRAAARGRWSLAYGLEKREQVADLIAFYRATKVRARGFRFKDWTDYQALAQSLGVGDGSTKALQLVKHHSSGGVIETRPIAKPVAGTVKIYRDGAEATSAWAVDTTMGLVTFSLAPAVGVQVTADFAFDVPVRSVDGWLGGGVLGWKIGANAGRSTEVGAGTQATGQLKLFLSMGYAMESGDLFRIHRGRDEQLDPCIDRFATVPSFRGEPCVPSADLLVSYPDSL